MTAIIRWLLIGVLLCSPIAIAQHKLDHLKHIQTLEQCDLCSHIQVCEPDISPSNHQLVSFPKQRQTYTEESFSPLSTVVMLVFQQRAPPLEAPS